MLRTDARPAGSRGVTLLELLGCFVALIGGVYLGATYLGVDVKEMTIAGLRQTGLLKTVVQPTAKCSAEGLLAAATEGPQELAAPNGFLLKAESAKPAVAGAEARQPASETGATPRTAEPPAPGAAAFAGPAAGLANQLISPEDLISLTDEQRRVLTAAYWKTIQTCMQQEVEHRFASVRDSGNWQLFDYLTGRKLGHQQAALDIAALKTNGVDPHVVAFAEKALAWHREGTKLFDRAVSLLTDAPSAKLSGPIAQSWQSASTQHRMEEKLLQEKQAAVKNYLDHAAQAEAATTPASSETSPVVAPPIAPQPNQAAAN